MVGRLLPTVLAPCDPGDAAELAAAVLDGVLVPQGPAFLPVDLPAGPGTRAVALLPHLGRGAVIARGSAAWVWGATWRLERPVHSYAAARRTRAALPGAAVHEVRLTDTDVVLVEDIPVTSGLRTALDLACAPEPAFDQQVLGRMLAIAGLSARALAVELDRRPRLPGRRSAARRLQVLFTR